MASIYRYIAAEASAEIARGFADGIIERCLKLANFPKRGTPRDDLGQGVRTLAFRRRVTIAYEVNQDRVTILGLFYAGREIEVPDPN